MYDEFRSCATQDATTTSGKSLGFLFEFFENIHTTGMPTEALTHDFVTLVEKSLKEGTDSGLAKLGNIVFNLQMSPLIKARLDNLMTGDLRARLETIATA